MHRKTVLIKKISIFEFSQRYSLTFTAWLLSNSFKTVTGKLQNKTKITKKDTGFYFYFYAHEQNDLSNFEVFESYY